MSLSKAIGMSLFCVEIVPTMMGRYQTRYLSIRIILNFHFEYFNENQALAFCLEKMNE